MEINKNINNYKNSYYTILEMYNVSFFKVIAIQLLLLIAVLLFDYNLEIIVLILYTIFSLFIFKFLRKNKNIIKYQIGIHQTFVLFLLSISIGWFLFTEAAQELYLFLFIGVGISYFLIKQKVIITYLIIYHILIFVLSLYYPIVELSFIFYSLLFSSASIFIGKWLFLLLQNSRELNISEKKYRYLFEESNNAVLLLEWVNNRFEIINSNTSSENLFLFEKENFKKKVFKNLVLNVVKNNLETDNKDPDVCKQLIQLKNQEILNIECLFKKSNQESFIADVSFSMISFNNKKIIQVLINDISEKKEQEIKISETIQSFKNIVNSSPSSIFIFTDDYLVYKNSKGEQIFNTYLNTNAKTIFDIFPKKQKYLLQELMTENNDETNAYTEIVLGDDKTKKTFSVSQVEVIYKGENSKLLMLMDITLQTEYNEQKARVKSVEKANIRLSEEISNHKRTQKYLLENTSKLNALFESSNNLYILTINRDLKIASFNNSYKSMMQDNLQIKVEIGNDFLNAFPIEEIDYPELIKKIKLVLRGDSVEIISHFSTGKSEIWIESFISPIKVDGEPIKEIAFIAHNITDKVENERKVQDSEANNRATVSAIPDMLFKVNKSGYFTDYRLNKDGGEVLKKFTFTSELLGVHIFEVFKNKKQAKVFLSNIEKALRTGKVHTQNFIIPFIIGKTKKKMVFENRYSRVNDEEVIVITRDVTDKVEFETQLIESVKEKEILLKEVHHRVKNNLQVISSILNLQSSYVEDEKTLEIINESQNRIRSMSYIHESLYQTKDFSSINFHDYITNLVQNLVHSYQLFSGKTKLILDIDHVQLALDQAIPCGLILNELVSNSLKYAYPEDVGGEIVIRIKENKGKIRICVEDFGAGLPEGFKIEESDSLGLGLVDTLVDQIDGELILKTGNGTKFLITFEKQDL